MKDVTIRSNYDYFVLSNISNENSWPKIENVELIKSLLKIADNQFSNKDISGYLSSILIYQQIIETFLTNLIRLSNLYIQAEIWPTRVKMEIKPKLMFGQIINEITRSIEFNKKAELIKDCQEFKSIRIKFVHGLLKFKNDKEISDEAGLIRNKFSSILDLYLQGTCFMEWLLGDLKKRVDWEDLLESEEF